MIDFISSVRKAIADENYHCALFIALSIPDICGKLETPNVGNGARSRRWFEENLKQKYFPDSTYDYIKATDPKALEALPAEFLKEIKNQKPEITLEPDVFWALRNAFLHEASDQIKAQKVHITHSESHMNEFDGAIQLSAKIFCDDICDAATLWLERVKTDKDVWERVNSRAKIKNTILDGAVHFE